MPKKSEATGATYAGHEGIVQDANQQLWEVDPSRNADGTVVDGFESDERELSSPNEPTAPTRADDDLAASETDDAGQEKPRSVKAEASDAQEEGGSSSAGSNSSASKTSPASSTPKTQKR